MRWAVSFIISLCITGGVLSAAYADGGFSVCTGCHNGTTAPDIKDKYRSSDELIRAAKMTKDARMSAYKNNEKLLREAAKDLGLK